MQSFAVLQKSITFMILIGLFQGRTVITRNVCFCNYTYAILLMEIFAETHLVHTLFEEEKTVG